MGTLSVSGPIKGFGIFKLFLPYRLSAPNIQRKHWVFYHPPGSVLTSGLSASLEIINNEYNLHMDKGNE